MLNIALILLLGWLLQTARTTENDHDEIRSCLLAAVEGDSTLIALPDQPFYYLRSVRPYNLNLLVTPAAMTFPKSTDQVASIVKCAADGGYKVQPRCGGHSYGNYGLSRVPNLEYAWEPLIRLQGSVVPTARSLLI
jgi:hypothetical protein